MYFTSSAPNFTNGCRFKMMALEHTVYLLCFPGRLLNMPTRVFFQVFAIYIHFFKHLFLFLKRSYS